MKWLFKNIFLVVILLFSTNVIAKTEVAKQKALPAVAMHGEVKYKTGFNHVEYVNPDAPKGGELHLSSSGSFDSLNPYIIKGVAAPGLQSFLSNIVYQPLFTSTADEPFSEYGLIAKSMEMPDDRSWVVFNLRPEAKWNDGVPITADDVVWTFNTLMKKGHPFFRAYYANVKSAVAINPHRVKFTFNMKGNRELPLIMSQINILPKHFWKGKDFSKTSLKPPLGSGPYRVKSVEAGRRIIYERVKNWWAKDLPITKGMYNFDKITYDVFRDETVLLQGLFSGNYDFRNENSSKSWHAEYDVPPVKNGLIIKREIHHSIPQGMQAFIFNIRRSMFSDVKVRKALGYAFDFEWSNKQFAYGTYKRSKSYFANSELASSGLPSGRELEILNKFKDKLPSELFTQKFTLPKTSGSGRDIRKNLRLAKALLKSAGWKIGDNGLLEKDGQEFKFEILISSPVLERWINPMILNLKKLGIEANLRLVDVSQYINRIENFDFDMTVSNFRQSLSPGNEQRDFWGSDKADIRGSRNIIGIKNPVVDALINMIISAPSRNELVAITHALDRVLLWQYYVIPQWYLGYFRTAYWDKFGHPDISPKYGMGVTTTWWYDKKKADNISSKIKNQ